MSNNNNNIDRSIKITYPIYKQLVGPISDLISYAVDLKRELLELNDNEEDDPCFIKYAMRIMDPEEYNGRTRLNEIVDIIISQYHSAANNNLQPRFYPLLPISEINNAKLLDRLSILLDSYDKDNSIGFGLHLQGIAYNLIYNSETSYEIPRHIIESIPNRVKYTAVMDIITSCSNQNNNYNSYNNSNNNLNNYNVNNMPNNTQFNTINSNSTPKNGMNSKQCFDPLMAINTNITPGSTILYITNAANKVIRTVCLDEDSFTGVLMGTNSLFYQCKDSVPVGSIFIGKSNVHPTRLRKIATDIIVYVYENQVKRITPGKKYILTPTEKPVGSIASYDVVNGGTVVSADHCQNNYKNDMIHEIKEYIAGGKRRRITKKKSKKSTKRKYKRTVRK
jgi:hypothetical protein